MFADLVSRAKPAVVMVVCPDLDKKGSGFLVSRDGHVVTNNHVVTRVSITNGAVTVDYSTKIFVVVNGQSHSASLVINTADDRPVVFDYALLKVDSPATFSYLEVGEPQAVKQGDGIICLGFPLDFETLIATSGIVSAVVRRPSHVNALHTMTTIVTDALVQFGNSGGPMVHAESGKVVGINTLGHELRDVLRQRLEAWVSHPSADDFPLLRDHVIYSLKYTYVGLNHAVSIEHVRGDQSWKSEVEVG